MTLIAPGMCRHCGCHGDSCSLPDGDRCSIGERDTVCSAPGCQRAELQRVAAARALQRAYVSANHDEQLKREAERKQQVRAKFAPRRKKGRAA